VSFFHNVSFKVVTKVASIRFNTVANHVVSSSHTTFIQGRNILVRTIIFHEIVHELHRKKLNEVISTLDLENVYDKFKWFFSIRISESNDF
jgi:hypothetical protein